MNSHDASPQPTGMRTDVICELLVIAVALGLSVLYAPCFHDMDRDSGVFQYAGMQMLSGQKPYTDFWDHKPPVIYLLNAAGQAMGADRWGVWLIETMLFVAGAWVLFGAMRKQMSLPAGLAGMAAILLTLRCGTYFLGGNLTESYVSSFQMFLLAGLLGNSSRWAAWAGMGVCAGLILFTKQSCIFLPAAMGLALLIAAMGHRTREACRPLLGYVLGGGVVVAAMVGWMASAGILREFWDCNFVFNRVYVAAGAFPDTPGKQQGAMRVLFDMGMIALAGAAMLGCFLRLVRSGGPPALRRTAAVVLMAIPLELAAISLPGTFYGHYFLSLFPLVGVGMAMLANELLPRFFASRQKAAWNVVLLIAVVVLPLARPLGLFPGQAQTLAFKPANIDAEMRTYLQRDAGQPLLMWGAETKWNFLSRRPAPTRYVYNYPLCYRAYDQERRFAEFLDALKRHPDTLIIDAEALTYNSLQGKVPNPAPTVAPEISPPLMNQLREYLGDRYRRDRVFANGWVAYRPK